MFRRFFKRLNEPVPQAQLPSPIARTVGLLCLVLGGLLVMIATAVLVGGESSNCPDATIGLVFGLILIGIGVAIDRDRARKQ